MNCSIVGNKATIWMWVSVALFSLVFIALRSPQLVGQSRDHFSNIYQVILTDTVIPRGVIVPTIPHDNHTGSRRKEEFNSSRYRKTTDPTPPAHYSVVSPTIVSRPKVVVDIIIGCYGAPLPPTSTPHAANQSDCLQKCKNKYYIYTIYYSRSKSCSCSDKFTLYGALPPENCVSNQSNKVQLSVHTSAHHIVHQGTAIRGIGGHASRQKRRVRKTTPTYPAHVTKIGNTTGVLVEKYFTSKAGRGCLCTTDDCGSISCHLNKTSCWVGPKIPHLLPYVKRKPAGKPCLANQYTLTRHLKVPTKTVAGVGQEYCISEDDLYGFWPVSKCNKYHQSSVTDINTRLFHIQPPSQGSKHSDNGAVEVYAKSRPNQTQILLLGYYRSGSTFTSELFRNHHDAFYLFEPFFAITPMKISHEHELIYPYITNQISQATSAIFNCDLLSLPYGTFNKFLQMDVLYKWCSKSTATVDCLAMFTTSCQHQRLTVIKSIRLRMASAESVISTTHPDMKVVLLLRDPRGMMNSRLTTVGSPDAEYKRSPTAIKKHAGMLCEAMAEDLRKAKRLKAKNPSQVVLVHYEDIAKHSTTAAQYIYRELDIGKPPLEVNDAIDRLTGKKTKGGIADFGVFRANSLATAYKWKREMKFSTVKLIDEACTTSYKELGYQPIATEKDLKDMLNYHRKFNELH